MGREVVAGVVDWEAALRLERARLVRLCTRFTDDVETAEDLLQWGPRDSVVAVREMRHVCIQCAVCHTTVVNSLKGLALYLPEGRRFWREHRRIPALPERAVEAAGCPAIVAGFESLTSQARLNIVCARDTYEVLGVHGAPEA